MVSIRIDIHICGSILDNGLHQLVEFPTRKGSILDLVIVNDPLIINNLAVCCPLGRSDHNMIEFDLLVNCIEGDANNDVIDIVSYNFDKADWSSIRSALTDVNWNAICLGFTDVDSMWNAFCIILWKIIDLHVPKRDQVAKLKDTDKRKLPIHIRKLFNKKASIWRIAKRTGSERRKSKHKEISKQCVDAVNKFHSDKELRLIDKGNLGSFYKYVNSKTSYKSGVAPLKKPDGSLAYDDLDKANLLNEFFSSVFTKDDGNVPYFQTSWSDTTPGLNSVCFTPDIIKKIVKKMKLNGSAGEDMFPSVLFKNVISEIAYHLSCVFNFSVSTSSIPVIWRSGIIVPIFKKGSANEVSNYRPISITCIACKLMESVIKDAILDHLQAHKLISRQQHGFIARHSTNTQLLECCNDWAIHLSAKKQVDIAYLDFAKAFDSVVHVKLLHKLQAYGIGGLILKWIKAFLCNRVQKVRIGRFVSDVCDVISGVPQGSVLGPILFIVYINDICYIPTTINDNITIKLFADDAKLYSCIDNIDSVNAMQLCLDKIVDWANVWQLQLSPAKCSILNLGKHRFINSYCIGGFRLPKVDNVRDLGVVIDNQLTFKLHINEICLKAKQRSALILRSLYTRNKLILIKAFTVYVRPLLEYCCNVWSPHLLGMIDCIENVQRSFTKKLQGLGCLSYNERLNVLNIDSLECRRLKTDLTMYYQIFHNCVDMDADNFFTLSTHQKTRGHGLKIRKPKIINFAHGNSFCNRAVSVWNALPGNIVNSDTLASFKTKLKAINLELYCKRSY